LIFGLALLTIWLPLPQPFSPPPGKERNMVVAALTGVLGLGYLVGLVVYLPLLTRSYKMNPGTGLDATRGITWLTYIAGHQQPLVDPQSLAPKPWRSPLRCLVLCWPS
jgi:hypothetical protein